MINRFFTTIRLFLIVLFFTGIAYPLFITGIAQIMSRKANGSLIFHDNTILGSTLISQKNEDNKYFWPRPSAIDYNPLAPSGGSNLGPTSQKLKELIQKRKEKIGLRAPRELLFASGSGLDPHISLNNAYYQINRIAETRSISKIEIKKLIDAHIEGRQLGFIGPLYINVVLLNLALDDLFIDPQNNINFSSKENG